MIRVSRSECVDIRYLTITVFAAGVGVCLGLAYLAARFDFEDHSRLVIELVGLSWLLLFLPRFVNGWSAAAVTLAALAALVLLNRLPVDLSLPLAVAGLALGAAGLGRWLRHTPPLQALLFAGMIVLFSVWLAATIWEGHTTTPLIVESLAVNRIDNDPLFHASITNMIRTYGVPTTGLDGLPVVNYHYGSHWLFAQLLQTDALTFYAIGFPVLFLPLLFQALLGFALEVGRRVAPDVKRLPRGFWLVFLTATVGVLPNMIDRSILIQDRVFFSESYTVALMLMFLGLALLLRMPQPLAMLFIPVYLAALGFAKVSVMLVLAAAGLYLFVRLGWYRRPLWLFTVAISALAVGVVYRLVSLGTSSISLFYQLWNNVNEELIFFLLIFTYGWVWALIAIKLGLLRLRTVSDLQDAVRGRRLLDVEAVIVMAVVGLIPGNVFEIRGGSAFYFSDIHRWVAVALVLGHLAAFSNRWRPAFRLRPDTRLAQLALGVLVVLWLLMLGQNVLTPVPRMLEFNRTTRAWLRSAGTERPILTTLHALTALRQEEKRETALFIPLSNRDYWGLLERCYYMPFVAPAVTGMAMLQGLPAPDCPLVDFLFPHFRRPANTERLAPDDDAAICAYAVVRGFRQVIVLPAGNVQRRLECSANSP